MNRRLVAAVLSLSLSLLLIVGAQAASAPSATASASTMPEIVDAPLLYENPVPAAPAVDLDWFSDAIFIGDSRLLAMANSTYVPVKEVLSSSRINVQSVRTQSEFTEHNLSLAQALSGLSFSKLYLMLGLNEASWMDDSTFYQEYGALIDDLRDLAPQARIYIQTILPVTSYRSAAQSPNNALLFRRNYLLAQLAKEKQVCLVDTAAPFTEPGGLPTELSPDGLYLTAKGYERWLNYLRTHTVGT